MHRIQEQKQSAGVKKSFFIRGGRLEEGRSQILSRTQGKWQSRRHHGRRVGITPDLMTDSDRAWKDLSRKVGISFLSSSILELSWQTSPTVLATPRPDRWRYSGSDGWFRTGLKRSIQDTLNFLSKCIRSRDIRTNTFFWNLNLFLTHSKILVLPPLENGNPFSWEWKFLGKFSYSFFLQQIFGGKLFGISTDLKLRLKRL